MRKLLFSCAFSSVIHLAAAMPGSAQVQVATSPATQSSLRFETGVEPRAFDVSPVGPEVAVIVGGPGASTSQVILWTPGDTGRPERWSVPKGFSPQWIAWHPRERVFFLAGPEGSGYAIQRVGKTPGGWEASVVYRTEREIVRLVVGPTRYTPGHRLFFGARVSPDAFGIRTITEKGESEYQLLGPASGRVVPEVKFEPPNQIEAAAALPAGFHPGGHKLYWEDGLGCFHVATYGDGNWAGTRPVADGTFCEGGLTPTPNGLGLIHWRPERSGVALSLDHGKTEAPLALDARYLSRPAIVPDGRGMVGIVETDGSRALLYKPIDVPLADVANAWQFLEDPGSPRGVELFESQGGLFRERSFEQLYQLYETEGYDAGQTRPRRPYLVTTDVFWELFAAAFRGTFIVVERQQTMPAFWRFVALARARLERALPESPWTKAFMAVDAVGRGEEGRNEEAGRILAAGTDGFEAAGGLPEFEYAELKPRGHYTATPEQQRYFRAVHYVTEVAGRTEFIESVNDLRALPEEVKKAALTWIDPYRAFIASPRRQLLWTDGPFSPPPYVKIHAGDPGTTRPDVFPLSFGFDNEVLNSTVFHASWPEAERIEGRLLPSGLDLAAALGNSLARTLLDEEVMSHPRLGPVLEDLAARYVARGKTDPKDARLYSRWIDALAVPWAGDLAWPGGTRAHLWPTKRLQTGLASWTSLRHTTVLVNERTSAEAGEGGFEWILFDPPRGYVEPDPKTFAAVAGLFEATRNIVASGSFSGEIKDYEGSLQQGILRRLDECAAKARLFGQIAEKEIEGKPLTDEEYAEINQVGRVAEYNFLVLKSLGGSDFALSNPDPMAKVVDVAGNLKTGLLMAAIGNPLEWDQIVPHFGRRQITKGAVYSYYEFASGEILDDEEWRRQLPRRERPAWVRPFVDAPPKPPDQP